MKIKLDFLLNTLLVILKFSIFEDCWLHIFSLNIIVSYLNFSHKYNCQWGQGLTQITNNHSKYNTDPKFSDRSVYSGYEYGLISSKSIKSGVLLNTFI